MNVPNWGDNYIDATNEIIGGVSDTIIIDGSTTTSNYLYITNNSNLNLYNPNTYGEIRLANLFTNGNTTRNHNVKIDYFGKLQVYHTYNLSTPTVFEGWKDVEAEIAGLIFGVQASVLDIIAVQGQIAGINAEITFLQGKVTGLEPFVTAINANMEALHYGFYSHSLYEEMVQNNFSTLINEIPSLVSSFRDVAFNTRVSQFVGGLVIPAAAGSVIGFFANHLDNHNLYVTYSNALNSNQNLTPEERKQLLQPSSNIIRNNYISFNSNFCNMTLEQGFINSNIITTQFIPSLKSNKILLGNITTPNSSYQMEMTGDLNTNMLWINSTSLTTLLNQKQNNLTPVSPLYITTGNIGITYDNSLTKVGNNLSVVKTATAPLNWTGNDIALSYDSTLLNNAGSLGVSISAESKWGYSGANIYNKTKTNVGIGTDSGLTYKLNVIGETYISSNTHIGISKLSFISSYTNSTLTLATGTNEYYLQYTGNGTLVLNEPCSCDLFLVGAGGNGGSGASSGGGGGAEVIYYQNFPLRNGTLNITVGTSSTTPSNRISSISHTSGTQISALGGGDGGIPDYLFTSGGSITLTINSTALFNYTDSVSISPATYTISFSNGNITLTGLSANRSFPLLKSGSTTIDPYIWFKFEDTYNYLVDSGSTGTFTLTNNGSTFDTTNYIRGYGSIVVDTGKNVSIASNINFYNIQTTNGITFSLWVKLTGGTAYGRLFHFSGADQSNDGMCCICRNAGGNGIQLNLWTTSSQRAILNDTSYNYFNNTWYFITWTISSSGVWSYYVNGVSISLTPVTYNFVSTKSYNVNKVIGGNYLGEYVTGNVDDFRIYAKELTSTEVLELYKGRVVIYSSPKSGGSGGGGAKNQTGASSGIKFDDYKSFSLSGLSGNSTTGGNGGCGNTTYNRYTTTITGSSLSVGLGGSGVGTTPVTPTTKTNYGDGGDGNGGVGFQGIVIIRFKADSNYLQVKAIKDNANSGLILNANESPNAYQLRIYPWSDTYQLTGIATRGWSFRCHDGNNNLDLLNLFSSFGGRIGIKTKNPSAILDVNGDIVCKTFSVIGNELYGITCQIGNQHDTGEANITVSAGTSGNYGAISLVYLPSQNLGYISCSKSLKIKTGNDALNSYIYIDNNSGYVGIGITNPQSKLELIGDIHSTSMTAYTGNYNSISTYSLALNNGNITGVNRVNSVDVWTGPVKATSLDLAGGNITNGGFFYGMAQQARFFNMSTNEWHYDDQSRQRFYFKNDTENTPANHFTLFKSGGTTHAFSDKDDVQYCLLDRFGITTYFEVVTVATDFLAVQEPNAQSTYQYRRILIKYNSFTEGHRCYIEDDLYMNDDDLFALEYEGRVVVSTGKIKQARKLEGQDWEILENKEAITIDDSQPIIQLSRKKKDKAVYGVITTRKEKSQEGRIYINGLGEGGIWVINTNGDLENGDLLQTSNEIGYAEKSDDDLIRSYTIGKVVMDCNFELDNPNYKCEVIDENRDLRRAFLACVYMCS